MTHPRIHPEIQEYRDRQLYADRQWFKEHPGITQQLRRPGPSEISELELLGIATDGLMLVTRLAQGCTTEYFAGDRLWPGVDGKKVPIRKIAQVLDSPAGIILPPGALRKLKKLATSKGFGKKGGAA